MQTLLIACRSAALADSLQELLCQEYQVFTCTRGDHALSLLETHRPEALIIDFGLPYLDGLTVLQQASFRPTAILALSDLASEYIHFSVHETGIAYIVSLPCKAKAICTHLQKISQFSQQHSCVPSPEKFVATHLDRLGYNPSLNGYKQICVGAPLLARDTSMPLTKELYPAIAVQCGNSNSTQVESSIRVATDGAWKNGDQAVWLSYFPNPKKRPSNGQVLHTMSKLIPEELL